MQHMGKLGNCKNREALLNYDLTLWVSSISTAPVKKGKNWDSSEYM